MNIRNLKLIITTALTYSIFGFIVLFYFDTPVLVIYSFSFLTILIVILYKKLITREETNTIEIRASFNQYQSLLFLFNKINFRKHLPRSRGFASSPDFLVTIYEAIKTYQPKNILECGSGLSTLIMGYTVEGQETNLFSLEQSNDEVTRTKNLINHHGLKFNLYLNHSPLTEYKDSKWYDISNISLPKVFDLIILDGPYEFDNYGVYRKHSLGNLSPYISDKTIIIMDDAKRDMPIIETWKKEYKLSVEFLNTEKGTVIIKFQ